MSPSDERSPEGLDPSDDADLLRRHLSGDPDAFGVLFRRHRDRLWAVALSTTGSPEDAADALQEAMIAAFRRAESFRGQAAVGTWLHRIVVNACLDRLRRNKVRRAEPLPDDLEEATARGAVLPETRSVDPAERAVEEDTRREVEVALARLPGDQRAALVLVDVQGYSVEEASRILQAPTGTIKSRCARGRAKLAPMLVHLRTPEGTEPVVSPSNPVDPSSPAAPSTNGSASRR